jgi:hypothetical protein
MRDTTSMSMLEQKLREFDLAHLDWSEKDYVHYAITQMDGNSLRELLIDDIKFRKEHGRNVVASIDGFQGTGKSLFISSFAIITSKIFGVPFNENFVFYSPVELDLALEKAKPCETYLRDEHKNSFHGEMSNLVNENLEDYEEQLRIDQINLFFAGVKLRSHAHFFIFEAKRTNFDLNGMPVSTTAVLKTPLYTNKNIFVWRGEITLPAPPLDYLEAYDKRKREYTQQQLKAKGENVFAQLKPYAEKVIKLREEDLIKKTREGFISPQKEEIIKLVVAEVVGSGKFTISAYRSLIAYIQDALKKKYFQYNEDLIKELEKKKQEQFEQRQKLLDERRREDEERRLRKEELQRMKIEIEKERVKLKKQLYEMRKQGLAPDKEEKESEDNASVGLD